MRRKGKAAGGRLSGGDWRLALNLFAPVFDSSIPTTETQPAFDALADGYVAGYEDAVATLRRDGAIDEQRAQSVQQFLQMLAQRKGGNA